MNPDPSLRTAVIGLGAMGLPMARHLAGAHPVVAFDPVPARLELLADSGAEAAATPAAAAGGATTVVLATRTLGQSEEALFGPEGAASALAEGAVVILTSTVGADGARHLAARLDAAGLRLLDLPVSGGPVRAGAGDLLAFAGGAPDILGAVRPVADRLASTIVVVGPEPGDGQAMKTVNQLLAGVHIAAAAEALALAKSLGIDPAVALEALGAGAAGSFMLTNRGPRIVEALDGSDPEVLSRVDIFVKDMGIVAEAARLYRLAEAAGLGAQDDSTITRLLGPQSPQ